MLFLTKIIFSSLRNFRNEKIFRKLFRSASKCVCMREGARSMFLAVIGIWLYLVKFHRARLSVLRQVSSCSRAMLRRFGKCPIPSVKFHRIVPVYLRSVKFSHVLAHDACFLVLDSSRKRREKGRVFQISKTPKT